MILRTPSLFLRMFCAALILFGATLIIASGGHAEANTIELMQETGYPMPSETLQDNFSYPFDTYTPPPGGETPFPEDTLPAGEATWTPVPTLSLEISLTAAPDIFGTEDAQMGDSLTTPLVSLTPAPSLTLANTATPLITTTITPESGLNDDSGSGGFRVNWGFFMAGFVVPVLVGCGVVLYFLDRRPDIFTLKRKP